MTSDRQLSEKRQLVFNLFAALTAFSFNFCVTLFLSPLIVRSIGAEANGFIQLANNFISYAVLFTTALNSMSGRFITISLTKNDLESARKYYTATLFGNIALTLVLVIPAVICILFLEDIVNITPALITDVRLLFAIVFTNFLLTTGFSAFNVSIFVKNRLYLASMRTIESKIINGVLIIALFALFAPRVYYVGVAAFVSTAFLIIYNVHYKRKLLPEIFAKKKYFSFKVIMELVMSGIWNSIQQCGSMLISGLDLLIANLYIGAEGMGILALAKMFPMLMSTLTGTVTYVFMPNMTIEYAKGDIERLKKTLDRGMKLTEIVITVPIACFIVFGREFFSLWMPEQDASLLQVLSLMTCAGFVLTSGILCLYNVFTIANKVKQNSIAVLIDGTLTLLTALLLLRFTTWGLFVIAGTSTVFNLLKTFIFVIPYAAKCLGLKKASFYPQIAYSAICVCTIMVMGFIVKLLIIINSWSTLIIAGAITAVVGICINLFIVLSKSERQYFYGFLRKRIMRQ